ncbi:CBS domain-containing protein [Diaphorobacter sp. HDW4A]|uniref:HPP family protein n=1 Tax=Diaphorobacter sp. HDW4A TaxID=2714924 RepID=UPI00140AE8F9|nr:HPP family protein [Diaphorobacter sp. HDW4A]QIL79480.1 CBS domain-containing protein [Diaphorobacter sp. HDW4A]
MTSVPPTQPTSASARTPETGPLSEGSRLSAADWLRRFWPAPLSIDRKERVRMLGGITLCVGSIAAIAQLWGLLHPPGLWMVASLAASSVLVIALPSSPLAQPWSVFGGSVMSAAVGVLIAQLVPQLVLAAVVAVGAAVALMLMLRCLHPPGASLALLAVLEPATHTGRYLGFVLFDVVLLLIVGIVYNRMTGRAYPPPKLAESVSKAASQGKPSPFIEADLDAALKSHNGVIDISRSDLESLLQHAAKAAFQRTLGDLRCDAIMSSPVHAIKEDASLSEGWELMQEQSVKALPVIDENQTVIGIVTTTDLLHQQFAQEQGEGLGWKLRALIPWRGAKKAQTIGSLMSSPVQVARIDQHVMDLVPMFSAKGRRHVPIVNDENRLVGIISQTDVIKTLANALAA